MNDPLPDNLPKVLDLIGDIAQFAPTGEVKLLCQVVPHVPDGTAWRMNYEVKSKEGSDVIVLNFTNDKLMFLPNVQTVAVEHKDEVRFVSEEIVRKLFRALDFFGNHCTYEAPRIGGVLAGCPRGEPISQDILVYEARYAMSLLLKSLDEYGVDWKWLDEYRESKLAPQEALDLKQLLQEAAKQLVEHNAEYHHRTPDDFIAKLETAAGRL
jgi:hypothetical protein